MGAKGSAGFTISSSSYISAENRWSVGGTIQGSTGLDATSFGVDDIIYDYSTTYGKRRWIIDEIYSASGATLNCYVTYDDPQTLSDATLQKPNTGGGTGAICRIYKKTTEAAVPSIIESYISEAMQAQIISDNDAIPTPVQSGTTTTYIVSGQINGNSPTDPSTLDEGIVYIVTTTGTSGATTYTLNELYQVVNEEWILLNDQSGQQINVSTNLTGGTATYQANSAYIYNETADTWTLLGSNGPTGPTGTAGVAGPTGPAGTAGVAGPTGPAGATGAIGPTGPAGTGGGTAADITVDSSGFNGVLSSADNTAQKALATIDRGVSTFNRTFVY